MNFIQRNPGDPKHEEFHDGEYEYWPMEASTGAKSISIPATVLSGLELIASVAAAGLLAAALMAMYVISAPRYIEKNTALINVNIYNNSDNQDIHYTLSRTADPDTILQEGTLEEDSESLLLQGLSSGTEYLLLYYETDDDPEQIGKFRFTTPGDPQEPLSTDPSAETEPPSEPAESTEVTDPPETTEETTEETVAETTEPEEEEEEPTEPTDPIYYPPRPPADQPEDDDPEVTEPEVTEPEVTEPEVTEPEVTEPEVTEPEVTEPEVTEPEVTEPEVTEPEVTEPEVTEPEVTEPEVIPPEVAPEPEIGYVEYFPPEVSGDLVPAYFRWEEYHVFYNVPAGDHTIKITQNGTEIEEYEQTYTDDGTLVIRFTTGLAGVGETVTTEVTLTCDSGSVTSTNTVIPPSLESGDITVTKNADGSYTFTVTAHALSDGTQQLYCEAFLYTHYDDYEGVTLELTQESSDRYTGSHTAFFTTDREEEEAFVIISAYWDRVAGEYSQNWSNIYYYTP